MWFANINLKKKVLLIIKYMYIFRLVLMVLVAGKENLTVVSTGLTGRTKNLYPTGNPTGRFPFLNHMLFKFFFGSTLR